MGSGSRVSDGCGAVEADIDAIGGRYRKIIVKGKALIWEGSSVAVVCGSRHGISGCSCVIRIFGGGLVTGDDGDIVIIMWWGSATRGGDQLGIVT